VLLLVASAEPLTTEVSAARAIALAPEDFAELGVFGPADAAAALILDEHGARAFSEGAPSNTDDRNLLEMRSFAIARGDLEPRELATALAPHDALTQPSLAFDRAYLVRWLLARQLGIRARRVARAADDPVERATALGLIEVAADHPVKGRRLLERALQLDPEAREARAGLLRLQRSAIATGAAAVGALVSGLEDPEAAVVEGWRAEATRSWSAARDLEARLARVGPQDPLFADAMRLRIGWRLAEGGPLLAQEVVTLADQLVPVTGSAGDLLLRARALSVIGDAAGAVVTLFQTANRLRPAAADRSVPRQALRLLSALPTEASSVEERQQLEVRLQSAR
jgi:hypothetical protein